MHSHSASITIHSQFHIHVTTSKLTSLLTASQQSCLLKRQTMVEHEREPRHLLSLLPQAVTWTDFSTPLPRIPSSAYKDSTPNFALRPLLHNTRVSPRRWNHMLFAENFKASYKCARLGLPKCPIPDFVYSVRYRSILCVDLITTDDSIYTSSQGHDAERPVSLLGERKSGIRMANVGYKCARSALPSTLSAISCTIYSMTLPYMRRTHHHKPFNLFFTSSPRCQTTRLFSRSTKHSVKSVSMQRSLQIYSTRATKLLFPQFRALFTHYVCFLCVELITTNDSTNTLLQYVFW